MYKKAELPWFRKPPSSLKSKFLNMIPMTWHCISSAVLSLIKKTGRQIFPCLDPLKFKNQSYICIMFRNYPQLFSKVTVLAKKSLQWGSVFCQLLLVDRPQVSQWLLFLIFMVAFVARYSYRFFLENSSWKSSYISYPFLTWFFFFILLLIPQISLT